MWGLRVGNVTQYFQMGLSWKLQNAWSHLYIYTTLTQLGLGTFPEHVFIDYLANSEPETSEQGWNSYVHFWIKSWYLLNRH